MGKHTRDELQLLQALPLEVKIKKTEQRIREWATHFGLEHVYVSLSGGKDSTVLLHIARKIYPDIKAVHVNTSLEYPEIEKFVKVYANPENICAVYPRFDKRHAKEITVIQFPGNDKNYLEVIESVDSVACMMEGE